jgi:predicted chitinase
MSQFSDLVKKDSLGEINVGLRSASEATMLAVLGRPNGTLTTDEKNNLISPKAALLLQTRNVGPFSATGIKPALDSLTKIFDDVQKQNANLFAVISTAGMLSVRMRRPTSQKPSTEISNHAWGTAVDITIDGRLDLKPDGILTRGIAELIPFFNAKGWFSGAGFKDAEDDAHFEVAEETILAWDALGRFGSPQATTTASLPDGPTETPSVNAKALLVKAMDDLGVKDPKLRAGIAAIAEAESGFRPRSEEGYSHTKVDRIREVFGNRVADLNDLELAHLASNDEAFFNRVYGGTFGQQHLGNTEPGDGFKFRGRGIFQITGRANYKKYGTELNIDLIGNPDLANDAETAAKLAVVFMLDHNVGDDFDKMKHAVGGDVSALADAKKNALFANNLRSGEFAA